MTAIEASAGSTSAPLSPLNIGVRLPSVGVLFLSSPSPPPNMPQPESRDRASRLAISFLLEIIPWILPQPQPP